MSSAATRALVLGWCLLSLLCTHATQPESEEMPPLVDRASTSTHGELLQRYLNDAVKSELPKTITDCIAHPELHSRAFCQEAEYLYEIGSYLSKYSFTTTSRASGKKRRPPKAPAVVDVSGEQKAVSYQYMFENFVARGKAFKGLMDSTEVPTDGDNHLAKCQAHIECARKLVVDSVFNDSSVGQIAELLSAEHKNLSLEVPKVAVGNYLFRLNKDQWKGELSSGTHILTHWPSTFHLKKSVHGNAHQCPGSMHMVLWTTAVSSKVRVRLFPQSLADYFGTTFDHSPLHSPGFKRHGFLPASDASDLPVFTDTLLGSFEFLFVPSTLLVSLSLDSEVHGSERTQLYRSCFVDASNFNSFRKYLELAGKVSQLESSLSRELSSPSFSTAMKRDAIDENYFILSGRSVAEQVKSEPDKAGGDADETGPSEEEPVTPRKGRNRANRRNRASGSGGVFKEWQENNKWNKMITSLTIPTPNPPSLSSIGRTNMTLEWTSPFLPSDGDKTRFGFNITLCSDPEGAADGSGKCLPFTFERTAVSSSEKRVPILRERNVRGSGAKLFSTDFLELEPSTVYRYRINLFFETFNSLSSEWSTLYTTAPLTAPSVISERKAFDERGNLVTPLVHPVSASPMSCTSLKVVAIKPVDDGGSPILGYRVYARFVDEGFNNEWLFNADYRGEELKEGLIAIEVKNIMPGPSQELAIAAYNAVGEAPMSLPSKPVTCVCDKKRQSKTALHVEGFRALYKPQASSKSARDHLVTHSALVVDGSKQVLTCHLPQEHRDLFELEVWSGHHSAGIAVTAPAVWADDDNEVLLGKVAIVSRGGEPLVLKARRVQKAGAVGLVVVDVEDRCDFYDQECVPGADKGRGEGWGKIDVASLWQRIHLPMVLARKNATDQLTACTDYKRIETTLHSEL